MSENEFLPRKKANEEDLLAVKDRTAFLSSGLNEQAKTVLEVKKNQTDLEKEVAILKTKFESTSLTATDAMREVAEFRRLRIQDAEQNQAVLRNFGIFFGLLTVLSTILGLVSFFRH